MEKVYRKFKGARQCLIVEVLEGAGTTESPMEVNNYVLDESGELIGVFKSGDISKLTNEYH